MTGIYTIGDRTFYQRKMGFLQSDLVLELLQDAIQRLDALTARGLVHALGDDKPTFMALVLVPENLDPEDHVRVLEDPAALEAAVTFFRQHAGYGELFQVVNDFLDCNAVSSTLEQFDRFQEALTRFLLDRTARIEAAMQKIGENGSSPSPAGATSGSA